MARIHWHEGRDLLTRTVVPGVVLWLVVVGAGLLVTGPLSVIDHKEDRISADFNRFRNDTLDPVSAVFSHVGNTEYVIAICLVAVGILYWRTRDLRWSVVPLVAISLQALIFLFATIAVGRQRPPAIPMDASPPTSSFPSGHTGAATGLYFTLALMALRIRQPALRRVVMTVCVAIPLLVATARLYRGMHHVSDVLVAIVNGALAALLAWCWLRRSESRGEVDQTRA